MTRGPWLRSVSTSLPPTLSVAVEEMSFQTSSASSTRVSASLSSTAETTAGPPAPAAGTVPMSQVTVPPETPAVPAPVPARAWVNVAPSGDGTVTVTLSNAWSVALVTNSREG